MKKIRYLLVVQDDLRAQHPEWIEPNGQSPICDEYERSLAELIQFFSISGNGARPIRSNLGTLFAYMSPLRDLSRIREYRRPRLRPE